MARRLLVLVALAALAGGSAAGARPPAIAERGSATAGDDRHFSAGEEVARTLTLATGVPISPLLGVSGLGAWRWWATPPAARALLPWYCRPWFWGGGISLALLFALNTTIGALIPGLKKPMDFVEEHENKLSGLLAAPIVLLEIRRILDVAGLLPAAEPARALASAGIASAADSGVFAALAGLGLAGLYLAVFAVVFLAFHAVQVVIALSPSVTLDLFLRGFRFSMLVAAAATAAVDPWFGAVYGLLILAACLLIAGWSFRLTVYGSVFSWEILAGRDGSGDPSGDRLTAFAGRGLDRVPVRSLGRLETGPDGGWRFRWRPWLVLPARAVPVGAGTGGARLAILRGAISPRLVRTGPVRETTLARFPPRFRTREEGLAARLGVPEVLDGRIVRGLRAAWRWLRDLVRGADATDLAPGRPS
jgi:hypothetical protein